MSNKTIRWVMLFTIVISVFILSAAAVYRIRVSTDDIKAHQDACKVAVIKHLESIETKLNRLLPREEWRQDTTKIKGRK